MKKLCFLPLILLLLVCLGATAFAANLPGQQTIIAVMDGNGYVTNLTDDDATTSWTQSSHGAPDLTLSLYSASVGEIWIRSGYAYTQNWYNHYDRPDVVKVTVYYQANRYTESYDVYRYRLMDEFRPNTVSESWNNGYQRLLLPKQYKNVNKIELTIESVANGTGGAGTAISDIIVASGSHATATPKSYATATPKPYVGTEESAAPALAADPIVQYMSRPQLEKSIERTRKLMTEAAKRLDFIEAAQYRDELLKLEEVLKGKGAPL